MCYGIRMLRWFHLVTQIIFIQNLNYSENAKMHVPTLFLYQLLKVKFELWLQILSHFHALGCFRFPKNLWFFRVNIKYKWHTLDMDVWCIPHSWKKITQLWKNIPHSWKSIKKIMSAHAFFFVFLGQFRLWMDIIWVARWNGVQILIPKHMWRSKIRLLEQK